MRSRLLLAGVLAAAALAGGCDSDDPEEAAVPDEATDEPTRTASADSGGRRGSRAVRLERVGTFEAPVYLTAPRGERDRQYVVERAGRVRVLDGGRTLPEPFLDISKDVSTDGERGLLSITFAPDYAKTGLLYLYFTDAEGAIRVQEMRRSASDRNRADPASRRDLLRQAHDEYSNHNGGQLAFGPDGLLYTGFGDGGGGGDPLESGQDRGTLLGKLLRIDPRAAGGRPYRIPEDNPFAGERGARPEIVAYGLRNPFRFSFDRDTGDVLIADQGQEEIEEVSYLPRSRLAGGANFGWNRFEGSERYGEGEAPGHVRPKLERRHDDGVCSITGGYVVRDPGLRDTEVGGRYVYGDLCAAEIRAAAIGPSGSSGDAGIGLSVSSLVSFGEDARGRVYAISIEGDVFRLAPR